MTFPFFFHMMPYCNLLPETTGIFLQSYSYHDFSSNPRIIITISMRYDLLCHFHSLDSAFLPLLPRKLSSDTLINKYLSISANTGSDTSDLIRHHQMPHGMLGKTTVHQLAAHSLIAGVSTGSSTAGASKAASSSEVGVNELL